MSNMDALEHPCEARIDAPRASEGTPEQATHYKGAVEPIELMSRLLTPEEFKGFLKGNMIKYASRAGRKTGESGEKDRTKFLVYSEWLKCVTEGSPIILGDKIVMVHKTEAPQEW